MIRQIDRAPKWFACRSALRAQWPLPARVMITTAPAPADAGSPADSPLAGAPGLVAWYAEGFSDVLGDRLRLFDNAGPGARAPPVPRRAWRRGPDSRRRCARGSTRWPRSAIRPLPRSERSSCSTTRLRNSPWSPNWWRASGCRPCSRAAEARGVRLDTTSAIWLLRQLLPALAALHDATGGAQHRLLDADRVVLTPTGEIAITEYVFGGLPEDMLPTARTTDVGQVGDARDRHPA